MGVDCTAVAGYGVIVEPNNLTEEGLALWDKYLEEDADFEQFVDVEFNDLAYNVTGSYYTGDITYWLSFEDPINNPRQYETFKNKLKKYSHLLINIEPKWFCETLWH